MSRIQEALKLIFSDYPDCTEDNRLMSNEGAAMAIGISPSLISRTLKIMRADKRPRCPVCRKLITD